MQDHVVSRAVREWSPVRNLVPWHSMATSNITSSLVQQTHMPPTDENDHHYKISGTHIALAFAAEVTSTSHAVPIPSEEDFNASFTEELLKPRHVDWLTRRCTWRFRGSTSTGCLAADSLHALPLSRAQHQLSSSISQQYTSSLIHENEGAVEMSELLESSMGLNLLPSKPTPRGLFHHKDQHAPRPDRSSLNAPSSRSGRNQKNT